MMFSSAHTRLTRTSSDLRVLSSILLPPSPVLKADDLLISSTSGEIPILLEATTHVWALPALGKPPGPCAAVKELKLIEKSDNIIENTRDLTHNDESLLRNRVWRTLDEMHVAKPSDWRHGDSPCNSYHPAKAIPDKLKSTGYLAYDDGLDDNTGRSSMCPIPGPVEQSKSEGLVRDSQAPYPNTMRACTATEVPKEDPNGDQLLMLATFHTCSTLPTPTFAPPSPSSSADVISPSCSLVGRQRHRRPLERARAVRFPGRPRSPRLQANETESNLMRSAPPSPTHTSFPRWKLSDSAAVSALPSTRVSDVVHQFMKHVTLPEELSWIKRMMIELWIDQEGFRAVRPCMWLMGYSPRTRSLHPYESAENVGSGMPAGVAEFMPIKRETFAFHYATLDSPPTLRMVSVAGDESRDYISRQATLSVKANGVYTVLGTESLVPSMLVSDVPGLRLYWKFDYLVSDRNVDGTGKTLPGEKTLTPLTFSCSPYLFHPLQGKKAGLIHIMKKNLAPKLGSQKLEPPAPSPRVPSQVPFYLSTGRDVTTHNRSHSDASAKNGHDSLTGFPLDTGTGRGTLLGMNYIQRTRRRRASSAGERSRNGP